MPLSFFRFTFGLIVGLCASEAISAADTPPTPSPTPAPAGPVTPDAMPETVALLQFLNSISGHYILSGQHNYPLIAARNSEFAADYTGKQPAVWTSDFGFSEDKDFDSYLARPVVVAEAIRQHRAGAIISLCWHAVPPTADEPITFQPGPNADPKVLKSVEGHLTDEQFKELLTPGTPLYNHWLTQVDAIAGFLKQLEDAHVPVIWRPYHEMNGDWFWWGGHTEGQYTTAMLYRQLFDRFVNHHHLKNLLWLWSMDRPSKPEREFIKYFPGLDYIDVIGLDVYGNDFAQSYYDTLVTLSGGKPLALAEVGNPPSPEIIAQQPRWTYYAIWAGMVRNTTAVQYNVVYTSKRVLALNDPTYAEVTKNYREAIGLPVLKADVAPVNFSGTWVLNEDASRYGANGGSYVPTKLEVTREGDTLTVRSTHVREFGDDEITEVKYNLAGVETKSEIMHSPRTTIAKISPDGSELTFDSTMTPSFAAPGTKWITHESWSIFGHGNRLAIQIETEGRDRNGKNQLWVYERR